MSRTAPPTPPPPTPDTATARPQIIQGGMGVAISDWRLARAVAATGELGVVSGTAIEIVCARRLQQGDPGGHVRRALAHFPIARIAEQMVASYFVDGGKPAEVPYRSVPMFSARPARILREMTIAATFVEVWLAKDGHDGPVGINLLRKIEAPIPFNVYGAMLAGVDDILVGAGNPHELPDMIDALARGEDVTLGMRVQGPTSGEVAIRFSPAELFDGQPPQLHRPRFLAIIASNDLAEGLATSTSARPDGFVVEGPAAGGHNAPPRGPRLLDERAQPVYGDQDVVDLVALRDLGLPFWLAGRYGSPAGLRDALAAGAAGVQVGTAFALCRDSGMAPGLRQAVLEQVASGSVDVLTDWRASPTGFPFKVIQVEDTLSDAQVYADRERICDLGALRVPFVRENGSLGYRCPAEPVDSYTGIKGARPANTTDRKCLCNALLASAGLPQTRRDGYVEPALATLGSDLAPVADLLERAGGDDRAYSATDVIDYLRGP